MIRNYIIITRWLFGEIKKKRKKGVIIYNGKISLQLDVREIKPDLLEHLNNKVMIFIRIE
jgi:hypothetical protein